MRAVHRVSYPTAPTALILCHDAYASPVPKFPSPLPRARTRSMVSYAYASMALPYPSPLFPWTAKTNSWM
ncbi:hypothetical protein BD309DRAFT_957413 [Dichomitus squalens]|nr:hypothetical protein BD309DRAFT_957413 [Dichomitus squalens]